jgi:hypothetical protein
MRHQWTVLIAVGGLAFICGIAGFARAHPDRGFFDWTYLAMQLFTLESGANVENPPLVLGLARFLAPVSLGYAAILAFLALVKDQLGMMFLPYIKGHAVFCGLDEAGLKLMRDFVRHHIRVVVIEADEEHPLLGECREMGGIVVGGDFRSRRVLRRARIETAAFFLAVSDTDGANLEAVFEAFHLITGRGKAGPTVKCFVRIDDVRLRALFWRHPVFTLDTDRFEIEMFGFFDLAARDVLTTFPLNERPDGVVLNNAHLAVAGFGGMGEALVMQAVRTCHYAGNEKLMVTVLDPDADRFRELFRQRYPALESVVNLRFLPLALEDPAFSSGSWLDGKKDGNEMLTLAVCEGDEITGLSRSLDFLTQTGGRPARVLLRVAENEGIAALLANQADAGLTAAIRPFAMSRDLCSWDNIVKRRLDRLARALHEQYRQSRLRAGESVQGNSALLPWSKLPENLKSSNRHQADHVVLKLRTLGCMLMRGGGEDDALPSFSEEQVERLARMEHRRWLADRFLSGWRLGPMDRENRVNPNLVPWETLTESVRESNRLAARELPGLLRSEGFRIGRIGKSGEG